MTTTASGSSKRVKTTGRSSCSPSSPISEHSSIQGTPQHIREWLTSLPQGSRVSLTLKPENVVARWMKETCGRRPLAYLESSGRDTHYWRMFQGLLWDETPTHGGLSETFPLLGMCVDGALYRLGIQADGTSETEFGYARRKYPTPSARDWRSGKASVETLERNCRPLNEFVTAIPSEGPNLNADWVGWLMAWPVDWTRLEPLADATTRPLTHEPEDIPRTCDKQPFRRQRLMALGNGWFSPSAVRAWRLLTGEWSNDLQGRGQGVLGGD